MVLCRSKITAGITHTENVCDFSQSSPLVYEREYGLHDSSPNIGINDTLVAGRQLMVGFRVAECANRRWLTDCRNSSPGCHPFTTLSSITSDVLKIAFLLAMASPQMIVLIGTSTTLGNPKCGEGFWILRYLSIVKEMKRVKLKRTEARMITHDLAVLYMNPVVQYIERAHNSNLTWDECLEANVSYLMKWGFLAKGC